MKAILTDITKCIGCSECVAACKREYNLPSDTPRRWQRGDGLSADNWTSIIRQPGGHFVRKQCRHCLHPACASVCPVGALEKTVEGPVIYHKEKCMGCRYCMMGCPYGIPRYDWDEAVPYVRKCIMCAPRLKEGRQPACTEACPTGATIFGERDELIASARNRIKNNPDKYIDKIWGEREVGGVCVLYISDIDLDFLTEGRKLGEAPLPEHTSTAMAAVPFAFVGMGALLTGLHWIVKRRQKLQAEETDGGDVNG